MYETFCHTQLCLPDVTCCQHRFHTHSIVGEMMLMTAPRTYHEKTRSSTMVSVPNAQRPLIKVEWWGHNVFLSGGLEVSSEEALSPSSACSRFGGLHEVAVTQLPYVLPPFRVSTLEHVYSDTGSKRVVLPVSWTYCGDAHVSSPGYITQKLCVRVEWRERLRILIMI